MAPPSHAGATVHVTLAPAAHRGWCAGTFRGQVWNVLTEPCPVGRACPAIQPLPVVGKFMFAREARLSRGPSASGRMELELPDGKTLTLPDGATGADAAAAIGAGLEAALAVKVDGEAPRLPRPLPENHDGGPAKLEILTDRSGDEALSLIRHDAAHVLAAAVIDLYPGCRSRSGRRSRTALLHFDFPDGVSLSEADLEGIEAEDARTHRGRRAVCRARKCPQRSAADRSPPGGSGYKVELIGGIRVETTEFRRFSLYTERTVHRTWAVVRTPASTKRIKAAEASSGRPASFLAGDSNKPM